MLVCGVLNIRPMDCCDMVPSKDLMRLMSSFVSFDREEPSPRGVDSGLVCFPLLKPFARRFLRAQSLWLSACVPIHKWSGLVHSGLSHVWHTTSPLGMGPLCNKYDIRCAYPESPCAKIRGLPLSVKGPDHPQHRLLRTTVLALSFCVTMSSMKLIIAELYDRPCVGSTGVF